MQLSKYSLPPTFEVLDMQHASAQDERINTFSFHGAIISVNHEVAVPCPPDEPEALLPREELALVLGAVGTSTGEAAIKMRLRDASVGNLRRKAIAKLGGDDYSLGQTSLRAVTSGVLDIQSPLRGTKDWFYSKPLVRVIQGWSEGKFFKDIIAPRSYGEKMVHSELRRLNLRNQGDSVLYGIIAGIVEAPDIPAMPSVDRLPIAWPTPPPSWRQSPRPDLVQLLG